MRRLLMFGGLLGAFLLALPSYGADDDGRECQDASDADIPLASKGTWTSTACIQLCDGVDKDDTTCDEYDFNSGLGMPDQLVLEYEDVGGDCDATPDFTFTVGPVTGGSPAYSPDSSALVMNPTVNRIVIITKEATMDRFLFTAIADNTVCTDMDVRMFFYNRKNRP